MAGGIFSVTRDTGLIEKLAYRNLDDKSKISHWYLRKIIDYRSTAI